METVDVDDSKDNNDPVMDIVTVDDDQNKVGDYISSGSKSIDTIFPNGFPVGVPSMTFASKDVGKTMMMYQLASALYKNREAKTLYIDTEGFSTEVDTRNKLLDIYKDRWDLDKRAPIDFLFPTDLKDLFEYVGKEFELVIKGKNNTVRASIWDETKTLESPLAKQLEEGGYKLLIVDSISQLFKEAIAVPPQQNFSTRASLFSSVLGRLRPMIKEFDIGGAFTCHESKNPANPYDTGAPFGSDNLTYTIKYVMQIRGNPKKEKRTLVRYRYPGLTSKRNKRTGEECKLANDVGYQP